MRSARLPQNLSVNATTRALQSLRQRGIQVLDLTISNPTCVGLEYPDDLLASFASPDALRYDPQPLGLWTAREAVAGDFDRRGLRVPPERIALTASTSEAYAWLFKLVCDPGDTVLVPRPSYPLFDHLTLLEAVDTRPYHLEFHGTWRVNVDEIREAIDARTRAILVVSPNNPTGSCLHPDDFAALDDLASAHGLLIIGDEVFADFVLDRAAPPVPLLRAPRATVCVLGGLSKSIGLPQVKLAWIAFGGPAQEVQPLVGAFEVIADTYLSVSTPVQVALPHLLARGADVRRQIQGRVADNLARLRAAVQAIPEISLIEPEAGWSAVLHVPRYRSEESLVLELLTHDHVLVHPGFFFDFDREAFVVVSLLVPPDEFEEGIARVLARASRPGTLS